MTTAEEFNNRYVNYLEEGHYGMDIHYPSVIKYIDKLKMNHNEKYRISL